jgi:hypothetical protein
MMKRFLLALGMASAFAGLAGLQAADNAAPAPATGVLYMSPEVPASGVAFIPPEVPTLSAFESPPPPKERLWLTGEYLFTWVRGDRLPILVTTSPTGTLASLAGVPGSPTTSTLIGDNNVNDTLRSGVRFGIGYWLLPDRALGVEAGTMWVDNEASALSAVSSGDPILARPFFNAALNNFPSSNLIAFPGSASGSVNVLASSGNFYEGHVDFTEELCDLGHYRNTLLLGYRFYRYDEGLQIGQTISPIGGSFVNGTQINTRDSFVTQNEFHGVDVGLRNEWFWNSLSLEVLAKISVGNLGSKVKIEGSQVVSVPGTAPLAQVGGLYALSSNIGTMTNDEWTVLPELNLALRWRANCHLQLSLGYSLLWLNQVARAPDQIDFSINPAFFPPATQTPTGGDHPSFNLSRSDVWLQSITFGAVFTY